MPDRDWTHIGSPAFPQRLARRLAETCGSRAVAWIVTYEAAGLSISVKLADGTECFIRVDDQFSLLDV